MQNKNKKNEREIRQNKKVKERKHPTQKKFEKA